MTIKKEPASKLSFASFQFTMCLVLCIPPIKGKTWEVKMILHSILCVKSKLMHYELTCALWEDQESISGIGGQSKPSGPSRWQFAVDHHTAGARWGAGEPKWNANTGHISQGSLIGTQLLRGPSIPWSAAEAEEPVGHRDQVRFSLCVQLKILGLKWLVETSGRETRKEQRNLL